MRKLYLLIFLFLLADSAQTQTITITGSGTASSYIYGPLYTFGTTAARYYRAAYIYPSSLLTSIPSGATIQSLGFERTGTQALAGGLNYKIYLQNTTLTDWGTSDLPWDVSGATLVYDDDPTAIVGNSAGWKTFPLTALFNYTGGNIAILIEYSQPAGTGTATTMNWVYQTSTTQPAYVINQTKYLSSTSTLPGSLTSESANHPNLEITYTTGPCTDPANAGNAISNAPLSGVCSGTDVILNLSGNSTGVGLIYKWQSSATQFGTYTDISAEDASPALVVNPTVTTWYKAVVKCGAGGTPQNSVPVQIVVNPTLPAGTYTINNTLATGGTNFQNFSDAIDRMKCGITGHVIFDVSAGQTFNESPEITFSGSSSSTVTFRKAGVGANPKISKAGTSATSDYLLKLTGADYITFDGIDFVQTGTSTADFVEYGIYIVNASITNGSQHNTFKNGTVTLDYISTSARGVFFDAVTTPTAVGGTNSFNRFLNMKIQNSFAGYYLTGNSTTYPDEGNVISTEGGGSSQIMNMGNGTTSGSVYGVYGTYQSNLVISKTDYSNFLGAGTSTIYGNYFLTSAIVTDNKAIREL